MRLRKALRLGLRSEISLEEMPALEVDELLAVDDVMGSPRDER